MADTQKVEVGLGIGQVVSARLTEDSLRGLREALEKGSGWYDLATEDGTVSLNLATVVFVKVESPHHSIGFSSS